MDEADFFFFFSRWDLTLSYASSMNPLIPLRASSSSAAEPEPEPPEAAPPPPLLLLLLLLLPFEDAVEPLEEALAVSYTHLTLPTKA